MARVTRMQEKVLATTASTSGDAHPVSAAPRAGRHRPWPLAPFALAAVVLLLIGFEIGIRQLPPDAVQVSASSADGHILVSHEIADARTATDLYSRINGVPSLGTCWQSCRRSCEPSGVTNPVTYRFGFLRWGLVVEAVTLQVGECYPYQWEFSSGGFVDRSSRLAGADQAQAILSEARLPPLPFQS